MNKLLLSSLLFSVSLSILLKINNTTPAFVKDNGQYIGVDQETTSTVTEREFDEIIDRLEDIYRPIIKEHGATLVMVSNWEDGTVNAFADRSGDKWFVKMFGGYARHNGMTPDAFALVVCHELGHHLGGLPKKVNLWGRKTWGASEGQSDYYASAKCMKFYLADKDNREFIDSLVIPKVATDKCSEVYSDLEQRVVCMRIAVAAEVLGKVRASRDGLTNSVSLESPDKTISMSTTVSTYPSSQCRLDTHFQGALCDIDPSIGASNSEIHKGYCARENGYKLGARPLCWFYPEKSYTQEEAVELFIDSCKKGKIDLVKLALSSSELDVNRAGKYEKTALLVAAEWGQTEVVKLLLGRPKIDVNKADKYGGTPLISASLEKYTEIVELLLAHPDIDVNQRDGDGDTALSVALLNNFSEIARLLREAGGIE